MDKFSTADEYHKGSHSDEEDDEDEDEHEDEVHNDALHPSLEYEYDEWYDHVDEIEIDFEDDPSYKKFVVENRSLKVINDTVKKLSKLRSKFQENQKEKFIKRKQKLLRNFNKRM